MFNVTAVTTSKCKCPVGTVYKEEIIYLKVNDAIKYFQFKYGQMSNENCAPFSFGTWPICFWLVVKLILYKGLRYMIEK